MKKLRQLLGVLLAILCVSSLVPAGHAAATTAVDAKAAVLVDAQTGQIIYQQNAKQKLPIASISKLLTVLVIEDEIAHGDLNWDTRVAISKDVAAVANNPEYSNAGLQQGATYTVGELIQAALIKSADGATLALAGAVGDSTAAFNQKMQKKARALGIKDAQIVNAVGLQNEDLPTKLQVKGVSGKAENEMSATDVAKIASYLLAHYPRAARVAGQRTMQLTTPNGASKTLTNINQLLTNAAYAVAGVKYTGLKTGTSHAAGYCLASSATYQGRTLVAVVLHANGTTTSRFTATQHLYQWLVDQQIQPCKIVLDAQKQHSLQQDGLLLKAVPSLIIWVKKGEPMPQYQAKIHFKAAALFADPISLVIEKNTMVGTVDIGEMKLPSLAHHRLHADLYTTQQVDKASFIRILWHRLVG
ncbi:D-alanyl-D-alanine carboxypeptidase family protein [Limosilactobacillus ingluviei]|uniref:D-alanyl-D-alanine carboxypeptidase family protein n=1 Tax=Limosilactobacillus ingluviei TaxID=148604 RepID=UPI00265ED2F6|nr:D-alanyl-D-alanine carboxypeptidase family protein [Limosilactobacillus ingluviei]